MKIDTVPPVSPQVVTQIRSAFRQMTDAVYHDTGKPGDEDRFLKKWWQEEHEGNFYIGCCNFTTRKASIFAIGATRLMCQGSTGDQAALRLLKMAAEELEAEIRGRQ